MPPAERLGSAEPRFKNTAVYVLSLVHTGVEVDKKVDGDSLSTATLLTLVTIVKVAAIGVTAAIYLKRVETEEKLLWRAYRNSPTRSSLR